MSEDQLDIYLHFLWLAFNGGTVIELRVAGAFVLGSDRHA
jgi:hypothetical protein